METGSQGEGRKKERNDMLQLYLMMLDTEADRGKFEEVYERYRKLMHWAANEILADGKLAEDAVQEAFLRIAKNFHGVGEIACPETKNFTVIITRRCALDILAKEKKHRQVASLDEILDEEGESCRSLDFMRADEDGVFDAVNHHALAEEIMALPEIYKEVMYIHGIYGYSLADTACLLGISQEAAKKRMQRGRTLLLKRLEGGEKDGR